MSGEITRRLCQGFGSATIEQELYFGWLAAQRFLGSIRTGGDTGSFRFADLSGAPQAILRSSSTTLLTPQDARRLIGQYVTHCKVTLHGAIGFVAPQEMLAGRQTQISPHATANPTPHA